MKKTLFLTAALAAASHLTAQQNPTASNPPNGGQNNGNYWSRAGNTNSGGQANNIFGTKWNSPIYFITGGLTQSTYRMRLNSNYYINTQYPINGYNGSTVNTSGYLGLGYNMNGIWSHNTGSSRGPFSVLHLNGRDGTFVQDGGFRPWMKTGITLTDNNDLSYMGLRKVGQGTDKTETTITWSDNAGNAFPGPDDMVFRFTSGGNGNTTTSSNLTDPTDLDGLHVARFTGTGNMGLGPTFGDPSLYSFYVRPQSLFHASRDGSNSTWLQVTNQNGTGQAAGDGLRIGINSGSSPSGYIRWQENTPFIVQTDWNNTSGGTGSGERMRVTSIAAPGVPNPATPLDNNITRVAISHHGSNPITVPRSLLHLGYNTGGFLGTNDGWRNWMDVGTFTANGSDNMYVGLKDEGNDRQDAVINWGDNQVPGTTPNGPDYLRFIFTSTTTALPPGTGDPVSQSNDGLEVARMHPGIASTLTNNYGMVGIGNYTTSGPNAGAPIDAKLDIDGDLRIRTVTQDSTLTQVLVIDQNDKNRVHWVDASTLGGNGFGNFCGDPANPITNNWEIPMDDYSYNFTTNQPLGRVNVGNINCNDFFPARLTSEITQIMDSSLKEHSAIIGYAKGTNFIPNTSQYGVWGVV